MLKRILYCVSLVLIVNLLSTAVIAQSDPRGITDLDALPPCDYAESLDMPHLQLGALVLDFASGRGCTENLDTPYPIASVPKIFIAGAFLNQVARGNLSFDTTMTFTQAYYMGGRNACLTQEMVGNELSYGYLSDIMISCSDNSATWMLMDVLGWENVQAYVDSLGIDGIGEIIPYSEVDRLKLTFIDERWATVPRGMSAQFWRTRTAFGLVPDYFNRMPSYTPEQRMAANRAYFQEYSYNTATPRAIAEYLFKLRDDLVNVGTPESQVAYWLFNTMILTQRQYSAQALPGTVYVGAKNGFDFGLRAEVSLVFPSLFTLSPESMVIVFAYQDEVNPADFGVGGDDFGRALSTNLTRTLSDLSPQITRTLYGDSPAPLPVTLSRTLPTIVLSSESALLDCAPSSAALEQIALCWSRLASGSQPRVNTGDSLGVGLILRDLDMRTQRLTFVFTAPDGTAYSYQWTVAERDATYIYWLHPVSSAGVWTVDVYQNLTHVYARTIPVLVG
jgi:beta-lactamase class A